MTLRFGVVGTGFASRVQIPALDKHPAVEVVSVCSQTARNAQATAERFDIPHWTTEMHELLDQDLDAVVISSPPRWHHPQTMVALERGLSVILEKPMAMNAREAEAMTEAACEAGVIAALDFEFRYLPARMELTRQIRDGFVGDLLYVHLTQFGNSRADAQTHPWSWWSDIEMGGGALGAMASHHLDSLMLWAGDVRAANGVVHTVVPERRLPDTEAMRRVTSDDSFSFQVEFESGALGVLTASTAVHHTQPLELMIFGSEGTLRYVGDEKLYGSRRGEALQEISLSEKFFELPEGISKASLAESYWLETPFLHLLDRFVQGMQGKNLYKGPSFTDGLRVQRVLDAVRRSSDHGLISP